MARKYHQNVVSSTNYVAFIVRGQHGAAEISVHRKGELFTTVSQYETSSNGAKKSAARELNRLENTKTDLEAYADFMDQVITSK